MPSSADVPQPPALEWDDAVLATLFAQAPTGLYVYDTQLRLVRVNAAARFFSTFSVGQMLGSPILQILRTFRVAGAVNGSAHGNHGRHGLTGRSLSVHVLGLVRTGSWIG